MTIIRRPDFAGGGITADEKQQMEQMAKDWTANAFSSKPVDVNEAAEAIRGLYRAAGLNDNINVVLVSSPIVMAAAYGAAAEIWTQRGLGNNKAGRASRAATSAFAATLDATLDATINATSAATTNAAADVTRAATRDATNAATTFAVTRAATRDATDAIDTATYAAARAVTDTAFATARATNAATIAATTFAVTRAADTATRATTHATFDVARNATINATDGATWAAMDNTTDRIGHASDDIIARAAMKACCAIGGSEALKQAKNWWRVRQGGNFWSAQCSFIAACRDVLGLRLLEHDAYAHWERCARVAGGLRVMHDKFCIITDTPEYMLVDDDNQPHCEDGPSHRWRDGWSLYHWHGVRVPGHWIEGTPDPAEILACEDVEQRAAGAEICGWARMMEALDAKIIHDSGDPDMGQLIEMTLPGLDNPGRFLRALCPRNGWIVEGVPYESDIDGLPIETAISAQAWRVGLALSEYQHPPRRT
jgi:hypothetical protein